MAETLQSKPKNPTWPRAEAVIGISCAVLVLLYAFQRLGTSVLGHLFAPIILLWFLAIFCVGVFNIATWYPGARYMPLFQCLFPALVPRHLLRGRLQHRHLVPWCAPTPFSTCKLCIPA